MTNLWFISTVLSTLSIAYEIHQFKDLTNTKIFNDGCVRRYFQILRLNDDQLLIGGRQFAYVLNAFNIAGPHLKSVEILSNDMDDMTYFCFNAQPPYDDIDEQMRFEMTCFRHIRYMQIYDPKHFILCAATGKNRYQSAQFLLDRQNLSRKGLTNETDSRLESKNGGFTEYGTEHFNQFCSTLQGEITQSLRDKHNRTWLAFLPLGDFLTLKRFENMITSPNFKIVRSRKTLFGGVGKFVGLLDIDDEYIYVVYYVLEQGQFKSFMVRVCKNDYGVNDLWEEAAGVFVSMSKIQIVCEQPPPVCLLDYNCLKVPKVFEQIVAIQYFHSTFFTVFQSPQNRYETAICAFDRKQISDAFAQERRNRLQRSSPLAFNCDNIPYDKLNNGRFATVNKKEGISVRSSNLTIIAREAGGDQSIALYCINILQYIVLFLSTADGRIFKLLKMRHADEIRVLSEWQLPMTQPRDRVLSALLYKKTSSLYISTLYDVYQIPLAQCSSYASFAACVSDPFCGWQKNECQNYQPQTQQDVSHTETTCTNYTLIQIHASFDQSVLLRWTGSCYSRPPFSWIDNKNQVITRSNKEFVMTPANDLLIVSLSEHHIGTIKLRDSNGFNFAHFVVSGSCDRECRYKKQFDDWCSAVQEYRTNLKLWNERVLSNTTSSSATTTSKLSPN